MKVDNLKYDGSLGIAVGAHRRAINWQNRNIRWSELARRLAAPTRTVETQSEYNSMAKTKRGDLKDVGGYVGGTLKSGRRKFDSVITRQLLTLDIDSVPRGDDPWPTITLIIGCAAVLYSTHSHTPESPRLRLVIPLSRPVTPDEYTAVARRVAGDVGIDMCDDTTYEAHRLMYWPSVSLDAEYRYEINDAPWLDADETLARYADWRDTTEWPVSVRKVGIASGLAKKQGDPLEKPGAVGAFCRTYSVEDAIEKFLSDIYEPCLIENRYNYIPADSSAGVVVYDDGKFVYSHHATDPICGKLCNAFDLVRLHLYGDKDDDAPAGTPVTRLPSYLSMFGMAISDEKVRKNLAEHKLKEVAAEFGEDEDTEWLKKLSVTAKGKIESTIDNALLILQNDSGLKGKYFYDEFHERPVICGNLPWQDLTQRISECWVDSDDSGLRRHLEKKYGITNISKICDAVELAMLKNKRHPVKEYIESLSWDGIPRADTIFIDYLDAEDNAYTREVSRKALIGAVARVMNPGCKHDHVLVLVGPQGCKKSTTLAKLGKSWFSDSLYAISGKDAYEQLQGFWLIELGEMAAMRKAEIEQLKLFISKQADNFRSAYARRTQEHPRQCAFFGSTNDYEFLRDPTGARRFWPVTVTERGKDLADTLTPEIVDRIWAEIYVRYSAGEQWHLSKECETLALEVQNTHTELNGKQGLIENYLETLLPENWENFKLEDRIAYFSPGFGEDTTGKVRRNRVCALEIWQELFKGEVKTFTQVQAREINGILRRLSNWCCNGAYNCGKIYGKQRVFIRRP